MKRSTIIWIIASIFVLLSILVALRWVMPGELTVEEAATIPPLGQTQTINNPQGQDYIPNADTSASGSSSVKMSEAVTLTSAGFSPAVVTIVKGGTVTWSNQSGSPMWVASAMHPEHIVYDGTSKNEHCAVGYAGPVPFDQCSTGESYRFTFNQSGTWKYHNHSNASQFGTVIVK